MDAWSINSIIFSLFLTFFFPILLTILYVIMFRKNPFTGFMKEWDELDELIEIAIKEKEDNPRGYRKVDPDDYWEYEDGEAHTYTGPTIRHPKNRDRAYDGSAERFHDGGW